MPPTWHLANGLQITGVDGTVVPIGLSSSTFDITAISDFDGTFEGKGVPKMGRSNAAALKARLRGIKTPRRPKAPKVPKLETFTPEEPTFVSWMEIPKGTASGGTPMKWNGMEWCLTKVIGDWYDDG